MYKYYTNNSYKRRAVRCNEADAGSKGQGARSKGQGKATSRRTEFGNARGKERNSGQRSFKKEDWMRFLHPDKMKLKGEEPDFSEEGWARRRPKKK